MVPTLIARLTVALLLLLSLDSRPTPVDQPTLARLAFWVPPEHMQKFEIAYREQILPVLVGHGLQPSSREGRATVDSVFSRLFTFATLDVFRAHRDSLWSSSSWQRLRQRLGTGFGAASDSLIPCQFTPYLCPAVPTRTVPAGGGDRRGEWRTYSVHDGLPSSWVMAILTDRVGSVWFVGPKGLTRYDGGDFVTFATPGDSPLLRDQNGGLWFDGLGGMTRYDGATFATFTAADGLAGGEVVTSILQNRNDHLWFGSERGVTRYDGETFRTFTARDGLPDDGAYPLLEDRDGILWFGVGFRGKGGGLSHGQTKGVVRYDGESFQTLMPGDGPVGHVVFSMLQDRDGHLWFGGDSQVTRFDGKRSRVFTTQDGLVGGDMKAMVEDRDGHLWFGSRSHGISRFDGDDFVSFTTEDGLPQNQILSIAQDEEGYLWVGTYGGLSRYQGAHWTTFAPADGLPSPYVRSVLQDHNGAIWFGTAGGLVRYDGEGMVRFTAEDGLAEGPADHLVEDLEGNLWIKGMGRSEVSRHDGESFTAFTLGDSLDLGWTKGPVVDRSGDVWFPTSRSGVVRYDGQRFSQLTTDDGLVSNRIGCVTKDRAGNMWFGSWGGGVSRYDGETFTSYTRAHGLKLQSISFIAGDSMGNVWFGSGSGAIVRYDGQRFETVLAGNGVLPGGVSTIREGREGHLWFGTYGAGIVRYDGLVSQGMHHRDGLIADSVQDIFQDRDGDVWISTDSGVTRYRPSTVPPGVRLTEVVAGRPYGSVEQLTLPSSQELIQFVFQGRSFSTPPERMAYVYRLQGYEPEWQATHDAQVRYRDLPTGDYVFQVKAVDRDLNYSEKSAQVRVTIHPDYGQIALRAVLGLSIVGLVILGVLVTRRRQERDRAREQLLREQEEELQAARDMQMGLMPTAPPETSGLSAAGRCVTVNHVGGDFYQYFEQHGALTISLADVTGHSMEAAIPAVMFSGILDNQMEQPTPLPELFQSLNRSLCRSLREHTFVCLSMVEIDAAEQTMRLSNCGCPYPLHYHAATGAISETQVDAYPLGVRPDTEFRVVEQGLGSGDYIVLHSDGFSEAANAEEQLFGFDRTMDVIRQGCSEGLSPEELIDRLIAEVKAFAGDEPQADDMTCVVVKVET